MRARLSVFLILLSSLLPPSAQATKSHGVDLRVLKEAIQNLSSGNYRMRAVEVGVEPGGVLTQSLFPEVSIAYLLDGPEGQIATVLDATVWRYENKGPHASKLVVFELVPTALTRGEEKRAGENDRLMLEREVAIPATAQKLILVHGTIRPGGSLGEQTHQGAEMRLMLAGSLTMTMSDKTTTVHKGEYFFAPPQTHMTKVEGDRTMRTDFIIFEVGAVKDVDADYHDADKSRVNGSHQPRLLPGFDLDTLREKP